VLVSFVIWVKLAIPQKLSEMDHITINYYQTRELFKIVMNYWGRVAALLMTVYTRGDSLVFLPLAK
jgi:hypothetical protein